MALKAMDESFKIFCILLTFKIFYNYIAETGYFEKNCHFSRNEVIFRFFILAKWPKTYPPADEKHRINLEWPYPVVFKSNV